MARPPKKAAGETPADKPVVSAPTSAATPAAGDTQLPPPVEPEARPADLAALVAEDADQARALMIERGVALAVRSISPRGRRRAGIAFGPVARPVDPADLDSDQLVALVSDSELVCLPVPLGTGDAD